MKPQISPKKSTPPVPKVEAKQTLLYIGNLPYNYSEQEVIDFLEPALKRPILKINRKIGPNIGFCHVLLT